MPYIIETRQPARDRILGKQWHHVDCTAVATLDEARAAVWAQVFDSRSRRIDGSEVDALPESGGTIGPLPDGTVIEVRPTTYHQLQQGLPYSSTYTPPTILAAFNAA